MDTALWRNIPSPGLGASSRESSSVEYLSKGAVPLMIQLPYVSLQELQSHPASFKFRKEFSLLWIFLKETTADAEVFLSVVFLWSIKSGGK